jgi:hypothetical protein
LAKRAAIKIPSRSRVVPLPRIDPLHILHPHPRPLNFGTSHTIIDIAQF